MRFYIIPLGLVHRILRKGVTRILGKEELEDLRADLVTPITQFVDEVYDDTVGDVMKDHHSVSCRPKNEGAEEMISEDRRA